jgi:hypothetical protein
MARTRRFWDATLPLLLCTALVSACGGESGTATWTVSLDTVGGRIRVINTPPVAGARVTVVGDEELRIGTSEEGGAASFGMVRTIAALPDGRIAVADAQAEEVRLFDRDGRHLRTFGGKGAGPGELQGMQGVYLDHEGCLRVPEQQNGRISIFDPDSGFVGSYPLQLFSYSFAGPWEAAIDSTGRTLVASSGQFGPGRFWNMLRVYDAEMVQLDSVPYYDYTDDTRRDDYPGTWLISMGRGQLHVPVPFYAQRKETLASTGEFWTSVDGRAELEIVRWTPPGDTTLVLYSRRPPVSVTAAARDSALAEVAARLSGRMGSTPRLDPAKVPPFKPPVHGLSLDDRSRLWVRLTGEGTQPTVYDIFDHDGRHAETVSLPFVVDIWIPPLTRGDTLWAVATNELDVQYVVRVRLRSVRME